MYKLYISYTIEAQMIQLLPQSLLFKDQTLVASMGGKYGCSNVEPEGS
jgi:hypothetical protein